MTELALHRVERFPCLRGLAKIPIPAVMKQSSTSTTRRCRNHEPRLCWVAFLAAATLACHGEAVDESPEHLVREFLLRMQRVHGDQKNARAAFELLWSPAQKNLTERASRASALAGRKVAPEEMLAPSRFTMRFEPKRIVANTRANDAVVTVQGDPPQRETREIRCAREDGRWRVVIDLPPLAPIQKRSESVKDE